jgi:glycosyltransferase involved in cell wall biosynthesis
MRDHDVFLFPTLFEGRALVVLEALSQGLPVITTRNSGTEDAVIDGVSGFIVPIQSVDAIVEALETLCSDRQLVHQMGEEAVKIAAKITWDKYRADLISVLTTSDIVG